MKMNERDYYISFIREHYKTLRGKPVEQCSNEQLLAVYYSLLNRIHKPTSKSQSANKELQMEPIYIYTDGACRNNQQSENLGAYAYKLIYKDKIKTYAQVVSNTTNNRMELQAALSALLAIKPTFRSHQIELYTDSQYVVQGINEWLDGWHKANYAKIKNPCLWRDMHKLKTNFTNLKVHHIKGHAGHTHQEEVDMLCNQALDNYKTNLNN